MVNPLDTGNGWGAAAGNSGTGSNGGLCRRQLSLSHLKILFNYSQGLHGQLLLVSGSKAAPGNSTELIKKLMPIRWERFVVRRSDPNRAPVECSADPNCIEKVARVAFCGSHVDMTKLVGHHNHTERGTVWQAIKFMITTR